MSHGGTARSSLEVEELWQRFHAVVNMTSRELLAWLGVDADLEPTPGPPARAPLGVAVVRVLGKRRTDLTDDDLSTMQAVVEIVESETAGRSYDDTAADERRRHRLMSVGHDPLRDT